MALTIKEIDGAKPSNKPYKLADGGGLCVLVPPSGAKLWRWRYRFDGKEKMMALGEYPLVSLKEARERHAEARKALASGTDPMAERKAEGEAKQKEAEARQREAENSFENVAREWWKWWLIGKSPRHADTTMRRMEADVFPAYGHKPVNEVTAADVRQLMIAVEKRDARDVSKRIHETTSQIFRFAIARDIAARNPAADFKPRDILAEAQTENRARVEFPSPAIDIEERHRRSNGRSSRHSVVSVRLTRSEQTELERMAKVDRKALSEWCRDALLAAARGEIITPLFTEIVAIRQLLNSTLRNVACGAVMTPESFQAELQGIRSSKHKAAAEVMQQYAATEAGQ